MRYDVTNAWKPIQTELFANQKSTEEKALELFKSHPDEGKKHLTGYGIFWGNKVVEKAWEFGDLLWTKYDEKF
jgi:hypothetical protein